MTDNSSIGGSRPILYPWMFFGVTWGVAALLTWLIAGVMGVSLPAEMPALFALGGIVYGLIRQWVL